MPDETAWQELTVIVEEFPTSWMIWESTPLPEVSERLESIGIRSVVFDPCANTPSDGDFLSVMRENVQALRLVFAAGNANSTNSLPRGTLPPLPEWRKWLTKRT